MMYIRESHRGYGSCVQIEHIMKKYKELIQQHFFIYINNIFYYLFAIVGNAVNKGDAR